MINVINTDVWGFKHVIRCIRNPLKDWNHSDTTFYDEDPDVSDGCFMKLGENDLLLLQMLTRCNPEHRKFARQLFVSMDIIAPLYWWKEFDAYKVGTVSFSCSTRFAIHEKKFTLDDFSTEHLMPYPSLEVFDKLLDALNIARNCYLECKDEETVKDWWMNMMQLLPSSYNQRRTITMSYENVFSIIKQREHSSLDEWQDFVELLKNLPYVSDFLQL